jgi:hypothetical protein
VRDLAGREDPVADIEVELGPAPGGVEGANLRRAVLDRRPPLLDGVAGGGRHDHLDIEAAVRRRPAARARVRQQHRLGLRLLGEPGDDRVGRALVHRRRIRVRHGDIVTPSASPIKVAA